MKRAIISGITGQDGSYLAELLLEKGYKVYGFIRRESFEKAGNSFKNIAHLMDDIEVIPISITNTLSIYKEISKIKPDEFYHLAAYSFVSYDMTDEINLMNVNFNSTLYIIGSIREVAPECKLFFAGSSEMFGEPVLAPQNEHTNFNPRSIYGIAKVSSYFVLKNFRNHNDVFASTGIMYNHESPRRGSQFVTKKIISTAVDIKYGKADKLELGNLEAKRDWGYAPDYVYAMWLILQQEEASDFVIATGQLHSVKQFVEMVFDLLNLDYTKYVVRNPKYYRPAEAIPLVGDASKLRALGWKQTKSLQEVIVEMIEFEKSRYAQEVPVI